MYKEEKIKNCRDIYSKEGKRLGCVCIATSKDFGKRDIILMPEDKPTTSVRSTTELMNKLQTLNVPFEKRKELVDFTAERLRDLELEESTHLIKGEPFSVSESKKKRV